MGDFSIFAKRIKELRRSFKVTQREFSALIGCTAATLSAYENGSKSPSLEIVKDIAEKCNVSIDWLCGLSNHQKTDSIETYRDLYMYLLLIGEKTNLRFETVSKKSVSSDPITTLWFDDFYILGFIEDWKKTKTLHDKGIIDDDIYNLWIEKVLVRDTLATEKINTSHAFASNPPEE